MARPLALTIGQIAALDVPGLPATPQGLRKLINRQEWSVRDIKARSGGQVYEVTGEIARLIQEAKRNAIAQTRVRNHEVAAIKPKVGRPRGSDYFSANPDIADIVRLIRSNYKHPAETVIKMIAAEVPGYPLPHLRTMQNFIARIERDEAAALMLLRDPDAYNGKTRLALGRADGGYSYAHQGWEVDTTPTDVLLIDEDGNPVRFAILGVIDVWSRRCILVLAKSESAQSVRTLIKRAIREWNAVPVRIRTDRGSGYINKTIISACEMMGVDLKACQPGDPRAKGFIERLFGTFTRQMSPILPGFIGHNVAQAQKIRAVNKKKTGRFEVRATLTCAEFQTIIDNWVRGDYEMRIHGTTRQAPITRAMQSPVAVEKAPSDNALKIIMSASLGVKTVTKRGVIWKRQRYFHEMLIARIGQPVHVRYDEDDLGALFILDGDGNHICTAINHIRADMTERDFAMAKRRAQVTWEKDVKAERRRVAAGFSIEDASAAMLRQNAEAAGKLTYLRPIDRNAPDIIDNRRDEDLSSAATAVKARGASVSALIPAALSPDKIAARAAASEAIIADHDAGYAVDAGKLRLARAFVEGPTYGAFIANRDGKSSIINIRRS